MIMTLWVLTLLSTIALSITYQMRLELKMIRTELDKAKSEPIAEAALIQALAVLAQDQGEYNALNGMWSNHTTQMYKYNPFNQIAVGEGTFTISYTYTKDVLSGYEQVFYGMQDEERRININKATQDMLESLPGITAEAASSIRAWRGDPEMPANDLLKEDVYYQGLAKPYKRKGKDFECLAELLLVRGITPELVFGKDLNNDGIIDINEGGLNRYLTVYGEGLVNINTAGLTVLRALGFTEDLSYAIMRYRNGPDEQISTTDDRIFTDVANIASAVSTVEPLLEQETTLLDQKKDLLTVSSQYFLVQIKASIPEKAEYYAWAVIDKQAEPGNQVISWKEI